MRAGVARERITLIPSGVDCAHFRPPSADERAQARAALGLGDADLAVGAVGALEPRKGHRYLVEAMALLSAARPPASGVVAIIAGDGSLRDALAADIRRFGLGDAGGGQVRLADRVRLVGRVDDARSILWALDIFVMPSLSEGLGVALLEAMACGLPCVASRIGGIVDAVDEGRSGILVAPGDAHALARCIGGFVRAGADADRDGSRGAEFGGRALLDGCDGLADG